MASCSATRPIDRRLHRLRREVAAALRAALRRLKLRTARPTRATPAQPPVAEGAQLRRALQALLDQHPASRRIMRHLGYVERQLARQGEAALAELPAEVAATALSQLDAIVSNWSNRDLADLRSKLAVTVKKQAEDAFFGAAGDRRSSFVTPSRLLVADVGHSVFEELQRQYQDLVPPERLEAVLGRAGAAPAVPTAV